MTPHPQADILRAIADGKTVQITIGTTDFADLTEVEAIKYLFQGLNLRVKPETIDINGHAVAPPVREPLKNGQEFYVAEITQIRRPVRFRWDSASDAMQSWLKRGLIHLTEAAATAHAEALLSFTRSDKCAN